MYTTRVDAFGGVDLEPLRRHGYTPGVTVCISLTSVGSILITIDDTPVLVEAKAQESIGAPKPLRSQGLARGRATDM